MAEYVSRAGQKLAGAASALGVDFKDKLVLDVGSSTGGFTDYALQNGASKVIAVDAGTDQMHPNLRADTRVELHEKTDIRNFKTSPVPDIALIDVSFVSLRDILPSVAKMASKNTQIVAMVKPQFEASQKEVQRGVIKNNTIRRNILKDFENWTRQRFLIVGKIDSGLAGASGNLERFYLLKKSN